MTALNWLSPRREIALQNRREKTKHFELGAVLARGSDAGLRGLGTRL